MNIRPFSQVPFRHGWKWLLLMLSIGPVCGASAPANLNILFTNGPASNRVNVIFFSEGYQTNQLPQFITNAYTAVSNLFSKPSTPQYNNPYIEYSNYFNAYAISVPSTNSGSNHSLTSYTNKTYFRSTYGTGGIPQLITIPPDNNLDSTYADGVGKVLALLTNQSLYSATNLAVATNVLNQITPFNRFVVLIVNDTNYGGSDTPPSATNPLPVAIISLGSSNNIPAAHIIVHESGHAIGGLADEYTNNYAIPAVERPNATMVTNMAQIPWIAWITNYDPNVIGLTPDPLVPTDPDGEDETVVGMYVGAEYNITGWYRPMEDCVMNHLYGSLGFCPVCQEAIIKGIYQKVDSIDSFLPNTNNNHVTIDATNGFAFSVAPLQPATHSLSLQWFTNSVAVPGATNSAFTLFPGNFTNGPCSVQLQTLDTTVIPNNPYYPYLVLNDPNHYLSNSVSWNVTVGLTALQIISPRWVNSGQFAFTVSGTAPYGFVIQASTNLVNWASLSTNTLTGGLFNYTNSAGFAQRYYRTVFTP